MFEGREVTHPGVLGYFKMNLHLEDGGYFILNRHGENVEKGYLDRVEGFPLFAVSASVDKEGRLTFTLDTGELAAISRSELFVCGTDALFFFHPQRGVPVRLKASAMMHAMDLMDEQNAGLVWKDGTAVCEHASPFPGPGG